MRLLVTGGRAFADTNRLERELERLDREHCIDVVIHGDGDGADRIARAWARRRGVPDHPFPADWRRFGRSAGPIRNQQMIDEAVPTHVLAMAGGNGTADMLARCHKAVIEQVPA